MTIRIRASVLVVLVTTATTIVLLTSPVAAIERSKAKYSDQTINDYQTDRTCWWNEMCKEEFSNKFKCRCPSWSFCTSPGRYYNAFCSMSSTGYIWSQPGNSYGFLYKPYPLNVASRLTKPRPKNGRLE